LSRFLVRVAPGLMSGPLDNYLIGVVVRWSL
jgi:hypothetical protein